MKMLLVFVCMSFILSTVGKSEEISRRRVPNITVDVDGRLYSCSGVNPTPTPSVECQERCQKTYLLETYVNSSWQKLTHCAFRTKCESLSDGTFKKTECEFFQTKNTYINSSWQDVISCAETKVTVIRQ